MRYIFSCGGGVQSTACLVLAAQGKIPYRTFIFANVGVKAESPATIKYIKEVLKPYAKLHGIEWIEVNKVNRKGEAVDLYDDCMNNAKVNINTVALQGWRLGFSQLYVEVEDSADSKMDQAQCS